MPVTYADMVTEVLEWSKRPDWETRAKRAIRAQTLKYHRLHKFFKDIVTVSYVNPTPSEGVIIVDIEAELPRWRQFARIALPGSLKPFEPTDVESLLDKDGYALTNVYLVAGTSLNIKSIAGFPTIDIAYYQDPIAEESGYNSWIGAEYPDLIIAGATARLFGFDNENEIVRTAKMEESEQLRTLIANNLEVEGR